MAVASSNPTVGDTRLHPLSGEFVDPRTESALRRDAIESHLHLYGLVALAIAVGFSTFSLLDLSSLGWSSTFAWLLGARLGVSALVLATRHRLLRRPEEFARDAGLNRIAGTQLVLYAVVLLTCALRPADAATNAVSVAVLILGAMVLVPGRFVVQVGIGVLGAAGFCAVAVLRYHDPALPLAPLAANLAVALAWGATILRLTNRDTRRRWAAVRASDRTNELLESELAAADRLRSELQTLARQDPLTGAANRRELWRVAATELGDRRHGGHTALIVIDADRFKSVNDRFGHAAGDAALVALVDSIRSAVRGEDLVARIGGEEFAVLLAGTTPEAALTTAERVRQAVAGSVRVGHDAVVLTVSVGVAATTVDDDTTVEELLARADEAMYRVKRAGGNGAAMALDTSDRAVGSHP